MISGNRIGSVGGGVILLFGRKRLRWGQGLRGHPRPLAKVKEAGSRRLPAVWLRLAGRLLRSSGKGVEGCARRVGKGVIVAMLARVGVVLWGRER